MLGSMARRLSVNLENGQVVRTNETAALRHAERVLGSGLFDAERYARMTQLTFASAFDAARHYVIEGEAQGYPPSLAFDPLAYLSLYPDLAALKSPLLLHFIDHGRTEGRVGTADLEGLLRPGAQRYQPTRETVLLCLHEASNTGAPILGFNIARQLSTSYNVAVMLLRDGPLVEPISRHAFLVVYTDDPRLKIASPGMQKRLLGTVLSKHRIDVVLANSLEVEAVVAPAEALGLPVVTLVHEFSEYVRKERLDNVLTSSRLVVFSSRLTEQSARAKADALLADFRHDRIAPQGKCRVPDERQTSAERRLEDLLAACRQDGRLLVIGCGFVQIRKGVDLFIAAAAKVVGELGRDRVRFIWVGDGFNPDSDLHYSVWIGDQIRRSGLAGVVEMVPAVASAALDRLYQAADLMFVSSRLDPFPNVAIDAMHAGLPIVCFDRATGVSEYLARVEGGSELVVPYLDVEAAAASLVKLLEHPSLRHRLKSELQALADQWFDMGRYVYRLRNFFIDAGRLAGQEGTDFETLCGQRLISRDVVGSAFVREMSDDQLLRRYIRLSAALRGAPWGRRPFLGFSPQIYVEHHPETAELPFPNPLAEWVRRGRPEGPWLRSPRELGSSKASDPSGLRVAVHLHLYYPELLEDVLRRLDISKARFDLMVSCGSEDARKSIETLLRRHRRGDVTVRAVPNRGRDIGPMITEFGALLSEYDVIAHIHGKKSKDNTARVADAWREFLFENLLGDRVAAFDENVAAFAANPKLGLVFPEDPHIVGWTENWDIASALAPRFGVVAPLPRAIEFPVGNMFFARPAAIAPLLHSGMGWEDYPEEPLLYDGTMLHAIERLLPSICEAQGFSWETTMVPGVTR